MAITRTEGVSLAGISTLRVGGTAREMATVGTEAELAELFRSMPEGRTWLVVGGGSNIIFPDGDFDALIIRYDASAISMTEENADTVLLTASAGAAWDDVVSYAVDRELSGIEALSLIPGSAGATPIQNVGAYGTEIKDVLRSVRAYDAHAKEFVSFSNEECGFGYRDSLFKHEGKGRYVITAITLALSRELPDVPQYPGVAEYFAEHGISRPSLEDIRNAIIAIRTKKLPDPKDAASVGSFFKNPFVPLAAASALKEKHPTLVVFPINETTAKLGAGSMIDALGWKGKRVGNFSFYKGNAMVIVNEGGGTKAELLGLVDRLNAELEKEYGLMLEMEPEMVGV